MSVLSPVTSLVKRVGWSRLYNFDFSNFGEFADDSPPQTITGTPTIVWTPASLTAGSAVVSGAVVQQQLSGGVVDTTYSGSCTITTSGGSTLILGGQVPVVA